MADTSGKSKQQTNEQDTEHFQFNKAMVIIVKYSQCSTHIIIHVVLIVLLWSVENTSLTFTASLTSVLTGKGHIFCCSKRKSSNFIHGNNIHPRYTRPKVDTCETLYSLLNEGCINVGPRSILISLRVFHFLINLKCINYSNGAMRFGADAKV